MADEANKEVKKKQQLVYRWEELEAEFENAHDHYVRRAGAMTKQQFLFWLIRTGCALEMKRKAIIK